eukprot:TRINITY_DN39361_c0_g1_i1.p1 TRINITY_DN39361_c0_g1~~TRINITY_DN39361_c0_g1_i1.p1  ORF type:complete len:470 (-),score=81.96 TRINITY_DN39361_c0_g1_i1:38-1447(-)
MRRPPRSTLSSSSAASDVYKRQPEPEPVAPKHKSPSPVPSDDEESEDALDAPLESRNQSEDEEGDSADEGKRTGSPIVSKPSSARRSVSKMNVDDILMSLSQDSKPSHTTATPASRRKGNVLGNQAKKAVGKRKLFKAGATLLDDVPGDDDLVEGSPTVAFDSLRLQLRGKAQQRAVKGVTKKRGKTAQEPTHWDEDDSEEETRSARKRRTQEEHVSRVEEIDTPDQEGSGRRGGRKRVKPLEYWNNEMPVYNAEGGLAQVVHRDKVSPAPVSQKRKPKAPPASAKKTTQSQPKLKTPKAKSKPKRGGTPGYEEEDEEEEEVTAALESQGFHQEVYPMAIVKDALSGEDTQIPIVKSAKMLDFDHNDDNSMSATAFDGVGWKCKVVLIPPQARTATAFTGDQTQVCVVLSGQIQVSVHKSHFVLAMGGQFYVPPQNVFAIRNLSHSRDCRVCLMSFTTIAPDQAAGGTD